MNGNIDPDLEQQITKSGLLASHIALRTALEAVIAALPDAAQRQVVAHLRAEADSFEQNFGQEHPPGRTEVPRRTKALRTLAGELEFRHWQELEQQVQQARELQWGDAGHPETGRESASPIAPSRSE